MNARVLVTAAGSIVAQGIIKSLKLANTGKNNPINYTIIAADMSAQAVGLYRADKGILIPHVNSPDYIDKLIVLCKNEDIGAIYVGSDDELLQIASNKVKIERETGAKVFSNQINLLLDTRDKWRTYKLLSTCNISVALTALPEDYEIIVKEFGYPVVVKPREGYGSLHFYIVKNYEELESAVKKIKDVGWRPIVQEYLKGDENEFTTGITIDRKGSYVMSSIAIKKTIKNGQTYKAFIDDYAEIRDHAKNAALKIGAIGAINIQTRMEGSMPKVIEINPRFSATCPLRAVAGINEPDIIFRNNILHEDLKIERYSKLVCFRYLNEVYMPYDIYQSACKSRTIEGMKSSYTVDYF